MRFTARLTICALTAFLAISAAYGANKPKSGSIAIGKDSLIKAETPQLDGFLPVQDKAAKEKPVQTTTRIPRPGDQMKSGATAKDYLKEGVSLFSQHRLAEAENSFHQALSRDPNNSDAYFNLGALAETRGDLNEALLDYRLAHQFNERDLQVTEALRDLEGRTYVPNVRGEHPAIVDANNPNLFHVNSVKNGSNAPIMSVGQNQPTSVGVNQPQSSQKGTLSKIAGTAFQVSPLHCPVCHVIIPMIKSIKSDGER